MAYDQKKDSKEQSANASVEQDNQDMGGQDTSAAPQQQEDGQDREAEKTESTVADILDGEKALHEMRRLRMKQQRPASGKDW